MSLSGHSKARVAAVVANEQHSNQITIQHTKNDRIRKPADNATTEVRIDNRKEERFRLQAPERRVDFVQVLGTEAGPSAFVVGCRVDLRR